MKWYERMNAALSYIEDNLTQEIDFDKIASIACQSPVGFQRTFSIVTDISVFEYIRRRRMTLAAFELQHSNTKVIDIALEYGYESPEAFTRAFKEIHGIPPRMARQKGSVLTSFPRITFLLTVRGDAAMDYRIENKDAFTVYGIEGIFTPSEGKNLTDIPKFWLDCIADGSFDKLVNSTNDPKARIHSICQYRQTAGNTFPYMLFAYRTASSDMRGFTRVDVPAATWAVFRTEKHPKEETSGVLQKLIKRIYTDWLPTAGYTKIDGHELELYFDSDDGMSYCETCIRVKPNS